MAEYIVALGVEAELWLVWEFIAADNPDAATKVVETAFATFTDKTVGWNTKDNRKKAQDAQKNRGYCTFCASWWPIRFHGL